MGTNCAPLLPDLFLSFCYFCHFIFIFLWSRIHSKNFYMKRKNLLLWPWIQRLDILTMFYPSTTIGRFYIPQLTWNKWHHRIIYFCLILGCFVEHRCRWKTNYSTVWQQDDFNFAIVNFPYTCSNIPLSPAYGVYISQLIRYARACSTYNQFSSQDRLLPDKLIRQGFLQSRLMSAFR
jgi:hypothetical protein